MRVSTDCNTVLVSRYFEGFAAWQAWGAAGNVVRGSNKAGQAYNRREQTVENYAEILGPNVHIRAHGTFKVEARMQMTQPARKCGPVLLPRIFSTSAQTQ
jgi:hypothetical protein